MAARADNSYEHKVLVGMPLPLLKRLELLQASTGRCRSELMREAVQFYFCFYDEVLERHKERVMIGSSSEGVVMPRTYKKNRT